MPGTSSRCLLLAIALASVVSPAKGLRRRGADPDVPSPDVVPALRPRRGILWAAAKQAEPDPHHEMPLAGVRQDAERGGASAAQAVVGAAVLSTLPGETHAFAQAVLEESSANQSAAAAWTDSPGAMLVKPTGASQYSRAHALANVSSLAKRSLATSAASTHTVPEAYGLSLAAPNGMYIPVPGSTSVVHALQPSHRPLDDRRQMQVDCWTRMLIALGSGTGLTAHGAAVTGIESVLRRDIDRRTKYQSDAVLLLVTMVYLASITVGLNFVYLQVQNRSPVTYYADPRYSTATMAGNALDDFLMAFNQPPKHAHLQVTGYTPLCDPSVRSLHTRRRGSIVDWQGEPYHVRFNFSLDLSSWISRVHGIESNQSQPHAPAGPGSSLRSYEEGLTSEGLGSIAYFLTHDTNDLSRIELRKEVEWQGWEELATNIKQKIRQQGFSGTVHVQCVECETTSIYKNTVWANFMHSRATKALLAVSVVGFIPYLLYMRLRCQAALVRVRHRIDIAPQDYWSLVSDGLSAAGFQPISQPEDEAVAGGEGD